MASNLLKYHPVLLQVILKLCYSWNPVRTKQRRTHVQLVIHKEDTLPMALRRLHWSCLVYLVCWTQRILHTWNETNVRKTVSLDGSRLPSRKRRYGQYRKVADWMNLDCIFHLTDLEYSANLLMIIRLLAYRVSVLRGNKNWRKLRRYYFIFILKECPRKELWRGAFKSTKECWFLLNSSEK